MADHKSNEPGKLLIEDVIQTRYPYLNLTTGFVGTHLNNFRRSIASANPFAFPQIPSQDRMAFGLRYGNTFYNYLPYPNNIVFWKMFPSHYDPLHDEPRKQRSQVENFSPQRHSHFAFTAEKLPRGCVRTLDAFRRCTLINGEQNCSGESRDILKICPTWALDELKDKQRFLAKVAAVNQIQYNDALQVSDYNKGRSLKDVSDKTWIDGTKERLRPDTLWADERYSKITQAEINEAKKRVEERQKRRGAHATETHHDAHGHGEEAHYDYKHVNIKHPKPLYP